MANTLLKTGITTGNTVEAWHVTQSIDAFSGLEEYNISLSGSLDVTGSINSSTLTSISASSTYLSGANTYVNSLYVNNALYHPIRNVGNTSIINNSFTSPSIRILPGNTTIIDLTINSSNNIRLTCPETSTLSGDGGAKYTFLFTSGSWDSSAFRIDADGGDKMDILIIDGDSKTNSLIDKQSITLSSGSSATKINLETAGNGTDRWHCVIYCETGSQSTQYFTSI
jgi:hypothetical protein